MRSLVRSIPLLGILLIALLSVAPSEAIVHEYVEDFTTRTYCDTFHTTADWDTLAGEVGLFPFEIGLAGSYDTPGTAGGVAVAGDHAYVADMASGLQVIDISDPANPVSVGSCDTPGSAYDVAIAGDVAYVADYDGDLRVIDISDPTAPVSAGSCYILGDAHGIAVAGDRAYVAGMASGLQVIDISDPTNPVPAGSCDTPGYAFGVAIAGDHAYVADHESGLQVVDISDPTNPVSAGSIDTPGSTRDVAIAGDYAYLADGNSGLQVIDISDPTNPVSAGSIDTPGSAWGVAITGDLTYVADGSSGLRVIDISDPTNPVPAGSCDTPSHAYRVAVAGDHVYVADGSSGLQVIASGYQAGPLTVGSYDTPGWAGDVAVAGDHAYVADNEFGLQVIDISDPTNPALTGSWSASGHQAWGVAVAGDHAYVADYDFGLQVVDISDPTNPVLAGSCDTPDCALGVAIAGDYAYVGDGASGLQVVDISDPTNPVSVGSYDTSGFAWDVAIAGDYAYLAASYSGLQVIDISDPTNPALTGSWTASGEQAFGVAIAGDHAYVADGAYGGFTVIDISDPTAPVSVGSCFILTEARSIAVAGDRAYVADMYSGLRAIDISDPTNPVLVWSCDTPDNAFGVAIAGDHVYVADWDSGLRVIEVCQNVVISDANIARSLDIDPSGDDVIRARLSSTQTDPIVWELSADDGVSWREMSLDGWHEPASSGGGLMWRSTHVYTGGGVDPTCTELSVDWLYGFPAIESVIDIPDDQGGRVRLEFTRSGLDFAEELDDPIDDYNVWRRIDDPALLRDIRESAATPAGGRRANVGIPLAEYCGRLFWVSDNGRDRGDLPPGTWEVLGSFSATQQDSYLYEATTLADSSGSGTPYAVFCVTAHTTTPSIWYASPPDSGYSVDNIAPAVPAGFALNYTIVSGNELSWEASEDEDFQYFRVYRGDNEEFEPSPENLIHMTIAVVWLDPDGTPLHYYKVTALDHAGNESDPASPESVTGVDEPAIPARFALYRSVPNPLRSGTVIAYDVPADGGEVRLTVYDVAGRRVRTLVDGPQTAGRKSASWDGRDDRGNVVGSGVYYCRLEAPGYEQSIKITVLR